MRPQPLVSIRSCNPRRVIGDRAACSPSLDGEHLGDLDGELLGDLEVLADWWLRKTHRRLEEAICKGLPPGLAGSMSACVGVTSDWQHDAALRVNQSRLNMTHPSY
jgi:hypothetical protein